MKQNGLLFIFSLLTGLVNAQIQLEHTYPKGSLKRVSSDLSGERYVWGNNDPVSGLTFHVFGADHSDLGVSFSPFGLHSDLSLTGGPFLSENLLDDDLEMELVVPWTFDGEDVFGNTLIQQSGEQEYFFCYGFSVVPQLASKLICQRKVYALPGLALEHDYMGFAEIRRVVFPLDGERYLLTKSYSNYDGIHVYDASHNWLRKFKPDLDDHYSYVKTISQQYFNDDPALEVYGTKAAPNPDANGNNRLFQIIQEDGTILLSEPCTNGNAVNGIHIFFNNTLGQLVTKVLDTKTFELLHTFQGKVDAFSPDGIKKYYKAVPFLYDTLLIYDGDTFTAKNIALGYTVSYTQFARNRLANNGKLEIFFSVGSGPTSPNKKVVWMDEDGALLHIFGNAVGASIDKQVGMEDKLFVQFADSVQVYRFLTQSSGATVLPESREATVSPNPFLNTIEVVFPHTGNYTVTLSNIVGHLFWAQKIDNQEKVILNMPENIPDGMYLLSIISESLQQSIKVLKVR